MIRRIKNRGLAAIFSSGVSVALVLLFVPETWLSHAVQTSVLWGWALAVTLGVSGFWTLMWALEKRPHLFFQFWMGGMAFRLLFVGVACWAVSRFTPLNGMAVLGALALGYLLLSLLEAPFLMKASQAAG